MSKITRRDTKSATTKVEPTENTPDGSDTYHTNFVSSRIESLFLAGDVEWRIVRELPALGGEADLFLMQSDGYQDTLLKLYRKGISPKTEIVEILRDLDPEHVVQVYDVGQRDGRAYEVQEFIHNGSLADFLKKHGSIHPSSIQDHLHELYIAVSHLHSKGIIHRDLKPANILIRTFEPLDLVVTDFGIASRMEMSLIKTSSSRTVAYASPEALTGVISQASDWWGVGVMLLEMITGEHPFSGMNEHSMNYNLATRGVEVPKDLDAEWGKVLQGLLTKNPDHRWGQDELARWLSGDRSIPVANVNLQNSNQYDYKGYKFDGVEYFEPVELATALADNWQQSTKRILRGSVRRWCEEHLHDADLAHSLMDLEEEDGLTVDQKLCVALAELSGGGTFWRGEVLSVSTLLDQGREQIFEILYSPLFIEYLEKAGADTKSVGFDLKGLSQWFRSFLLEYIQEYGGEYEFDHFDYSKLIALYHDREKAESICNALSQEFYGLRMQSDDRIQEASGSDKCLLYATVRQEELWTAQERHRALNKDLILSVEKLKVILEDGGKVIETASGRMHKPLVIDFDLYHYIDDEAAQALSKHVSGGGGVVPSLSFNGLIGLSQKSAHFLSLIDPGATPNGGPSSCISLNGIKELKPEVARYLGQCKFDWLQLDGVEKLSVETANCLSHFRFWRLSLDGLLELTEDVAAELGNYGNYDQSPLGFDLSLGIHYLNESLASKVSDFNCTVIRMDKVTHLTLETADALNEFQGDEISLDGLQFVSDALALRFSNFPYMYLKSSDVDIINQTIAESDSGLLSPLACAKGNSEYAVQVKDYQYWTSEAANLIAGSSWGEVRYPCRQKSHQIIDVFINLGEPQNFYLKDPCLSIYRKIIEFGFKCRAEILNCENIFKYYYWSKYFNYEDEELLELEHRSHDLGVNIPRLGLKHISILRVIQEFKYNFSMLWFEKENDELSEDEIRYLLTTPSKYKCISTETISLKTAKYITSVIKEFKVVFERLSLWLDIGISDMIAKELGEKLPNSIRLYLNFSLSDLQAEYLGDRMGNVLSSSVIEEMMNDLLDNKSDVNYLANKLTCFDAITQKAAIRISEEMEHLVLLGLRDLNNNITNQLCRGKYETVQIGITDLNDDNKSIMRCESVMFNFPYLQINSQNINQIFGFEFNELLLGHSDLEFIEDEIDLLRDKVFSGGVLKLKVHKISDAQATWLSRFTCKSIFLPTLKKLSSNALWWLRRFKGNLELPDSDDLDIYQSTTYFTNSSDSSPSDGPFVLGEIQTYRLSNEIKWVWSDGWDEWVCPSTKPKLFDFDFWLFEQCNYTLRPPPPLN